MKELDFSDVRPLPEYEKIRDSFRQEVIQQKKKRHLQVGPYVSLAFENRETVLFQIQEMMRTEHLHDREKVQEEIDTFNDLIPGPRELSATLFIEITEQERVRPILDQLIGIDRDNRVYFEVGRKKKVFGVFESGRSNEEKISSVHYVRFKWSPAEIETFRMEDENHLVIDHPNYKHRTALTEETKKLLLEDLDSE